MNERRDVESVAAPELLDTNLDESPYVKPEFDEWYRRTRPRVVATVALGCGSLDLATEAADEAFVRAVARWPRVRVMRSPAAWVTTVALNVARRRERRRGIELRLLRRNRLDMTLPGPAGEVFDAVRQLPARQRTIVLLRYVVDASPDEIAESLGVSRSTVTTTLTNAHRRLAGLISEEGQ